MKKNPWLAAVLNFFLFGAGTLYVGRRMLPGLLLTVGGTVVQVIEISQSPPFVSPMWTLWPWFFGGLVLAKVGLAIDGYREALATH
jgi:hypothetical protein